MGKIYEERKAKKEKKLAELGVDIREVRKRTPVKQKDGTVKNKIVLSHYELRLRGIRKVFRTLDKPFLSMAYSNRKGGPSCPFIAIRRPKWFNFYYYEDTQTWSTKSPW